MISGGAHEVEFTVQGATWDEVVRRAEAQLEALVPDGLTVTYEMFVVPESILGDGLGGVRSVASWRAEVSARVNAAT